MAILWLSQRPIPLMPRPPSFLQQPLQPQFGKVSETSHHLDFIRTTMSAGCVGYFVQIMGRCVICLGRKGESHVEHFPPAPAN